MATPNSMHNLTTLIKRLEAATLRLEDIAESTIALSPQNTGAAPLTAIPPITQLNPAGTPPHPPPTAPVPAPPAHKAPVESLPEAIEEFDNFIKSSVGKYVSLSTNMGGLIAEQAGKVLDGFNEERKFLLLATKAKKPDLAGSEASLYQDLIKPINEALMSVLNYKDSNRGSPVFSQLSTVSEGIMLLAWVTVEHRPWKHVEECLGPAQFFGNRVLKEFKDKDPQQAEWVNSFYRVFRDLLEYVKEYYPNGVTWNPKGKNAADVLREISFAPASTVGGAPPPPPPPPPPGPPPSLNIDSDPAPAAASGGSGGFGAVFSELNKGADITKGLKKVDKSQMTHKNPSLRASSAVPDGSPTRGKSPAPGKKPKPESMRLKKPSRRELEGNKWTIENFEKESQPIIIEASISHSILISKCSHTTIVVKGKANAITIESTNRLNLVVDDLISTVDVVKSNNFALQVMGSIPTVLMDQIDSAELYFSKESCETRVFSSKSANINIMVPNDDDYKELPIPGQICSYFDKEKNTLVNEIVKHDG